eukprot:3666827-Pyramimonas_sp.AAC.1
MGGKGGGSSRATGISSSGSSRGAPTSGAAAVASGALVAPRAGQPQLGDPCAAAGGCLLYTSPSPRDRSLS